MTLKNDFYSIIERKDTDSDVKFTIKFNVSHPIYLGHFPENPITPGSCIIKIVKELSEDILQVPLFLKIANSIKFIKLINPLNNHQVTIVVTAEKVYKAEYKVKAIVVDGGETFAKLNLRFNERF